MFNFLDYSDIKGHLQIAKVFPSGEEQVVFDDHNIIVSGMGVGLSLMFAGSAINKITDYQITHFQVGVSGGSNLEVSTTYQLSTPLTAAQYGANSVLAIATLDQVINGAVQTNKTFLAIPFNNITRVTDNSVRFSLLLDENTANSISVNEVGLFMRNPLNRSTPACILVAYRSHTTIPKTSDFSLVYRWVIQF